MLRRIPCGVLQRHSDFVILSRPDRLLQRGLILRLKLLTRAIAMVKRSLMVSGKVAMAVAVAMATAVAKRVTEGRMQLLAEKRLASGR